MNYQQAVQAYSSNPTKETLHKQAAALCGEMTLKGKTYYPPMDRREESARGTESHRTSQEVIQRMMTR